MRAEAAIERTDAFLRYDKTQSLHEACVFHLTIDERLPEACPQDLQSIHPINIPTFHTNESDVLKEHSLHGDT